jgi:bacteriocin biosynthesis cyclodehydratase domain-containing protein
VLFELQQLLPVEEAEVEDLDHDSANGGRVLSPGTRMIERAGVLHFYDGRRLVSLDTDQQIRNAIAAVAALANAGTDLTELSKRLQLDEATVEQLVGLLNANALIDTTTTPSPWPASAPAQFVSGLGTTPVSSSLADERLATASVVVVGPESEILSEILQANGLRARSGMFSDLDDVDPANAVVVADALSPGEPNLFAVNQRSLDRSFSWLPIGSFDGEVIRVGPLMIPGQTPCLDCTVTRLAANVAYPSDYRDVVLEVPPAAAPPAVRSWAYSIAALTLMRWIGARDAAVPATVHTLVPRDLSIRSATVFRVPRCPTCRATDYTPATAPWETARVD